MEERNCFVGCGMRLRETKDKHIHEQKTIFHGGSRTAVSGLGAAEALEGIGNGTAEYYNAGGMRIGTLQKGLNVVKIGGRAKKVLVK